MSSKLNPKTKMAHTYPRPGKVVVTASPEAVATPTPEQEEPRELELNILPPEESTDLKEFINSDPELREVFADDEE